jgi:tetratricopeptide (TPR) repeat protein
MQLNDQANKEMEDLLKKGIVQKIEKATQMVNAVRYLEEAKNHISEALKYEPKHPVLTSNLEEVTQQVKYCSYNIKTRVGIERFEKEDYDQALTALDGNIPKDFPGYDTVIQIRAGCFFRRAIQHANHERFDAAVADMRQAQALVPDNEAVREQLSEIEKIRIDFPHLKTMREAESLLDRESFEDALEALKTIPSNFSGHERVQSLKAVCEFKLGLQCANDRDLEQAIAHLEKSAKYNPREQIIRDQLNQLYEIKLRGGFAAIERHNRAVQKAEEVVQELSTANARYPLTSERGYQLLAKLEEAANESDNDPQIIALRDQLRNALRGQPRY